MSIFGTWIEISTVVLLVLCGVALPRLLAVNVYRTSEIGVGGIWIAGVYSTSVITCVVG